VSAELTIEEIEEMFKLSDKEIVEKLDTLTRSQVCQFYNEVGKRMETLDNEFVRLHKIDESENWFLKFLSIDTELSVEKLKRERE
jgi:hypothetical protein